MPGLRKKTKTAVKGHWSTKRIIHSVVSFLFLSELICFLPLLFPRPRAPERPVGLTRTISPSVRPAWTSLPTGLAPCLWSTPRWGWTRSSSKTRCRYWGRNTEKSRGYNPHRTPQLPVLCRHNRCGDWWGGWLEEKSRRSFRVGSRETGSEETGTNVKDATFFFPSSLLSFSVSPFSCCCLVFVVQATELITSIATWTGKFAHLWSQSQKITACCIKVPNIDKPSASDTVCVCTLCTCLWTFFADRILITTEMTTLFRIVFNYFFIRCTNGQHDSLFFFSPLLS